MCAHAGDLQERLLSITGDVRCLAFSSSGEQLALGFEDGSLRVYQWPSLQVKLDLRCAGPVQHLDESGTMDEMP